MKVAKQNSNVRGPRFANPNARVLWAALVTAALTSTAGAQSFTSLGDFSGGAFNSVGCSLTPSGSAVIGWGNTASGLQAFTWTSGGGLTGLGYLPGGLSHSAAYGVNSSGTVVVGEGRNTSSFEAFRWTSGGGMTGLGFLPGHGESTAFGANSDGSVVVGYSSPIGGDEQAFRWSNGVMSSLGNLGGGNFSLAYASSADGNAVVGYTSVASGVTHQEGFMWTPVGGMIALGVLPGTNVHQSSAQGISADGTVAVGYSYSAAAGSGYEAFRWTQAGGMVGLGDLPGGAFFSSANAANADGSVIVGSGDTENGTEAFIWDSTNGMRNLKDLALGMGLTNVAGWQLTDATGVSADGLTIVGTGYNPLGDQEAFVIVIPEPSTASLAALGGVAIATLAWRRRLARS